jgi:hypothetical protein
MATEQQRRYERPRFAMTRLRWVFLALYALLVLALLSSWLLDDDLFALSIIVAIGLGAQVLFLAGAGTIDLCRPIRRRRLILPVICASLMLTVLVGGLSIALFELFEPFVSQITRPSPAINELVEHLSMLLLVSLLAGGWVLWGFLLFVFGQRWERLRFLKRFTAIAFFGSLAELLVTIPSHMIVIRRPGCIVGLGTMLGIIAGIAVMIWSFGPAIAILFLRPRYLKEMAAASRLCPVCGHDLRGAIVAGRRVCPECRQGIAEPESST